MNVKVAICVFVLGCALLANAKPSPRVPHQQRDARDTRKQRSAAKKAHRGNYHSLPRHRRSENQEDDAIERFRKIANATGKNYMLDLYKQLSNASVSTPVTQANSIKSLNYEKLSDECKFKFGLAGINKQEFVLRTELRLYLEPYVAEALTYIVQITAQSPIDGKNNVVQKEVVSKNFAGSLDAGGYVEFDVADIFRPFVGSAQSITFEVEVTQNPPTGALNCGKVIHFHSGKDNENKIPMLVVYSYDRSDIVNITETEKLILEHFNRSEIDTGLQRRKRTLPNTVCGRHSLHLPSTMISSNIIGENENFRIMIPTGFDAGICGGQCNSHNAHFQAKRHPLLINVLIKQGLLTENDLPSNLDFTQCCAPVSYESLHLLGVVNNVPIIRTVEHMIVNKCGCTDIVNLV